MDEELLDPFVNDGDDDETPETETGADSDFVEEDDDMADIPDTDI